MAIRVASTTGNWSSATIWETVTNTPTVHAANTVGVSSGTTTVSATFTAPNTTNRCTGALILINTAPSTSTYTLTLQESTVDTAATVTINAADLPALTWVYFRFATPYTFTTTVAGAYRFKMRANPTSQGTLVADSGGTLFAYMAVDDRSGALGATDDVWIASQNGSGTITVTLDGTRTCGSGTDTATLLTLSHRTIGAAVNIVKGGILTADLAASCQLTYKGHMYISNGGQLTVASSGTPYPEALTAKFIMDMTTTGNHGINLVPGGKILTYGKPKSSTSLWKTKYVSGTGTAASPLVVADSVDWIVGDEIKVCATSNSATNYNETETRYVITKNSATSYVVSSTRGGAETALTHTHTTDAWVLNVERNVIFETTDAAKGIYLYNQSSTVGDVVMPWVRWKNIGANVSGKQGLFLEQQAASIGNFDYNVFENILAGGPALSTSKVTDTHTGWICMGGTAASGPNGIGLSSCGSKTLTDCFAIDLQRTGLNMSSAYNCTFNRVYIISCNKANSTTTAGITFLGGGTNTFNDCEIHCCRTQGIVLSNATGTTFNNLLCGTKGQNQTTDILVSSGSFNDIVFVNSNFGSATFISGYLTQSPGSEIKFHNLNDITNNHIWYTAYGSARAVGSGLADTTVRTSGSLGVRIAPEDATTGFSWSFYIPAKANSIVNFYGFFRKNTAFGTDDANVELWLPGSTSANTASALNDTTEAWQAVSMSASYIGTVDGLATIKIIAKTSTASAYLYVDDLYNAGDGSSTTYDKVTGLDTWDQGKPITILAPQALSAADIWTFSTSQLTTAGTTGKQLKDALTTAKFLALK